MIVTFDTNGYRKLVEGLDTNEVRKIVSDIKAAEAKQGITAMMCSITAMELLSHLLDNENSRDYKSCRKAVIAMYGHCGNEKTTFHLPSPQTQMAVEYFSAQNVTAEETQKALGHAAFEFWKNPNKDTVEKYHDTFLSIKDHVKQSEKCLIEEILKLCRSIDPDYNDWHLFTDKPVNRHNFLKYVRSDEFRETTALAMLCAVHMQIADKCDSKYLNPELIQSFVTTFIKSYETALNLRQFFFEQILNPGFDLTSKSRANYLWDEQVLYFVGHTLNHEKILLVTDDKKMLEAAARSGLSDCVSTPSNYLATLAITKPTRI